MIELPIWLFIVLCVLAAPLVLIILLIVFAIIIGLFSALRMAAISDEAMGIKEGMQKED